MIIIIIMIMIIMMIIIIIIIDNDINIDNLFLRREKENWDTLLRSYR